MVSGVGQTPSHTHTHTRARVAVCDAAPPLHLLRSSLDCNAKQWRCVRWVMCSVKAVLLCLLMSLGPTLSLKADGGCAE